MSPERKRMMQRAIDLRMATVGDWFGASKAFADWIGIKPNHWSNIECGQNPITHSVEAKITDVIVDLDGRWLRTGRRGLTRGWIAEALKLAPWTGNFTPPPGMPTKPDDGGKTADQSKGPKRKKGRQSVHLA